jgi:hypothetical protein
MRLGGTEPNTPRNTPPPRSTGSAWGSYPAAYNDLIDLARLCLRQAEAARTAAAAVELRRMSEYRAPCCCPCDVVAFWCSGLRGSFDPRAAATAAARRGCKRDAQSSPQRRGAHGGSRPTRSVSAAKARALLTVFCWRPQLFSRTTAHSRQLFSQRTEGDNRRRRCRCCFGTCPS